MCNLGSMNLNFDLNFNLNFDFGFNVEVEVGGPKFPEPMSKPKSKSTMFYGLLPVVYIVYFRP